MRTWSSIIAGALALGACSSGDGRYPSLAPRAAEAIDPRLPVVRPMNDRPVSASLASQLASLVAEAREGDAAFEPAVANAEQLASAAGARQSESWIVAQEALSAAVAARKPTAMALSDIDALGANALQRQGGIAPNDLSAIQSAGAEVAKIASGQTDRIEAIQRKLGL
jgi:hypothetical protein